MILNYTEPQLNIDQILSVEVPSVPRQSAVIVGAQYVSPSFESKFEYDTFSDEGGNLELTFLDTDGRKTVDSDGLIYKLDADSVDVLVKDAEYNLFADGDGDEGVIGIIANPGASNSQVVTNKNLRVAGDGVLWSALYGRSISLGDTVYCYNQDELVQKRKVTGFIGKTIAATHGTGATEEGGPNSDNSFGASISNPVETATMGDYNIVDVTVPSGVYNSGGFDVSSVSPSSPKQAVNINGLSYRADGITYAGVKLTLRITSYSTGLASGSASLTSSDGSISTTATFTRVEGEGTYLDFDLSGSVSLHGLTSFTIAFTSPSSIPTVGQVFSFTVRTPYIPISLDGDINDGDSAYTGTQDNTFYVKVIQGSAAPGDTAILKIYDARGLTNIPNQNISYAAGVVTIDLGFGLEFVVDNEAVVDSGYPQYGFRKNDVYYINAVAARKSTTEFTGLTLDGPATYTGNVASIRLRGVANGSVTSNQQSGTGFEINGDGQSVDYFSNLTWFVAGRTSEKYVSLVDGVGSVYLNWRAIEVPSAVEGASQVYSREDLAKFGPVHPSNDVAFAAKIAFDKITGNSFYVLRTSGDEQADIAAALEKIENTDLTYALAIISDKPEAFYEAIDHAQAMSARNVKNFRRVYFGAKCPDEFTAISTDIDGNTAQATVTEYDGLFRLVAFTTDVQLVDNEVRKGDFVEIGGNRLVVEQVIDQTQLITTAASALLVAVDVPVNATIIKPNTALNQATYITQIAKVASNRRGSLIWCDSPVAYDGAGVPFELNPKFIAAEVAAVRSVTPAQLGLSRTKITSVAEAPTMYAKYKRSILNDIASKGVMIITQENEGSDVVIRHQLTTDVNNGNLYYEDSVGVNVDNLSFRIKDALDKYVGKRNITPSTLGIIRHDVFRILEDARTTSIADLEIGPQILNFYDEDNKVGKVTVKAHPTFKDRILVKVRVAIPLPMNVIEVEIEAVSEVVVVA